MGKQMNPKVSIIVPVYNVEDYLHQCIVSIIYQTYQNIEIILVNDGSTDNSGKICDSFVEQDNRIKVVHKQNGGLSDARNCGTNHATGDYIIYLDGDDWMDSETCMSAIEAVLNNSADIVFWGHKKEHSDGKNKEIPLFAANIKFSGNYKNWLHRRLIGLIGNELSYPTKTDAFSSAWGKLYRRDLISINKITFIDTKVIGSEDVLFNIEVFYRAKEIVYLNALFNHYRQDNPNAITKNHNSTLFPRFLNLFKHIEEFIQSNNLDQEYYTALNNRIALSIINSSLSITSKRNTDGILEKIRAIKKILENDLYRSAISRLELTNFTLPWKVFFVLCKYKFALEVYFLAFIVRKFR